MLVPIYLGLCTTRTPSVMEHAAAMGVVANNLGLAVLVSVVHAIAMIAAGGVIAWSVYRYFGLEAIQGLVQS